SLSAQEQTLVSGSPATGTNTIAFNFGNSDPNHFYYKNDGIAGHVTLANVAVTTTDDASLPTSGANAVDPDWNHSWFSIRPTSALPDITHAVTIDGYTQSGASANTNAVGQGLNTVLKVEIDGENAGQLPSGLLHVVTNGGTTIRGLAVNRAVGAEVYL